MSWESVADLVVVGTGVAGLTAALRARECGLRVSVITKDAAWVSNTAWAQGGVAVVEGEPKAWSAQEAGTLSPDNPVDSVSSHVNDTLQAGAGLCAETAVGTIISGGATAIRRLRRAGARFDMNSDGALSRTREGGHSASRVIHAGGDATGVEIQRALIARAAEVGIPILERYCVIQLVHADGGALAGALVLDPKGRPGLVHAPAVLLATGGLGQLYAATTNPDVATGDGIALALRAGATVADLEFIQFHPTVLFTPDNDSGHRPLVTEAVRGEGAVLVDAGGRRVMRGEHPREDLAPRDVVSAAVRRRIAATGAECVYLDATSIGAAFPERFPTVFAACQASGVDPVREPIPVTSAAHYSCGGVVSSVDGRTSVKGLYVAGEVARTGAHGANRLASNSLLEGLVMGARSAESVTGDIRTGRLRRKPVSNGADIVPAQAVVDRPMAQRVMSQYAGIGRTAEGMNTASAVLDQASVSRPLWTRQVVEDSSLALTAQAVLRAATARRESRGCHRRWDFPSTRRHGRESLAFRLDVSGWFIHAAPNEHGRVA